MADKELAIMRGMTGSGKSRAAAQMVARANTFNLTHTICSADDYWKTNEIPFSYSKLTAAHTYCQLLAIEAIQRGDSLII
ncbi:MAG: hypothetical protein KDB07_06635, partial [Planctomycetes bacterium]|nr:hypothetical protein [Planctomycetota bacterium]